MKIRWSKLNKWFLKFQNTYLTKRWAVVEILSISGQNILIGFRVQFLFLWLSDRSSGLFMSKCPHQVSLIFHSIQRHGCCCLRSCRYEGKELPAVTDSSGVDTRPRPTTPVWYSLFAHHAIHWELLCSDFWSIPKLCPKLIALSWIGLHYMYCQLTWFNQGIHVPMGPVPAVQPQNMHPVVSIFGHVLPWVCTYPTNESGEGVTFLRTLIWV